MSSAEFSRKRLSFIHQKIYPEAGYVTESLVSSSFDFLRAVNSPLALSVLA